MLIIIVSFPAVRACIFDMDGLLIDSEDIYSLCTNAVLREYGRPDLPWSVKAQLQGRPAPEVNVHSLPVRPPIHILTLIAPRDL